MAQGHIHLAPMERALYLAAALVVGVLLYRLRKARRGVRQDDLRRTGELAQEVPQKSVCRYSANDPLHGTRIRVGLPED